MKYYLYILKSAIAPRNYIGITDNAEKRLGQHNHGKVKSTKAYIPWKLVLMEEFQNRKEARQREIFLKRNYKARKEIFDKINNGPFV